ncbi:MAG: sulfotransferase domain-containing protein [Akkermansiaceae bacterium]
MINKKTFILGVGAQKCGTSWLHSQLVKNPSIDMGFTKEYHVFDALYADVCSDSRIQLINAVLEKNEKGILGTNHKKNANATRRLAFIDNTESYFDYFDYLYLRNSKIQAVGDITPSYSVLDHRAYQHIKNGLEQRGFQVKVILLMRDPIERVWSMVRMGRRILVENGKLSKSSEMDALNSAYKSAACVLRTSYDRTIKELERVFTNDNIYIGFYERLFSDDYFNVLQSFLGMKLKSPDTAFHVNRSPKEATLDPSVGAQIAQYYSDVYEFVSKKSDGVSENLWGGYKYLQ